MRKILGPALVAAASLVGTSAASATQRAHVATAAPSAHAAAAAPRTHVSTSNTHAPTARLAPSRGGSRGSWSRGFRHGRHGGWRWGWGWRGWGWGWGWGWAGYPGYWGAYYGAPYGGYGAYVAADWGVVKTDVSPEEARVYLDGRYIGTADDFDGYPDFLYLKPDRYRLEFRLDGFQTETVDIEARPGVKIKIDNKLKKVPGAKQYGSYDTPEPEGGIRRYWGKEKEQVVAIDADAGNGDSDEWRGRDAHEPPPYDEDVAPSEAPPVDREAPEPPRDGHPAAQPPSASVPGAKARILFRIEPGDAAVYVDDRFAGTGEELGSLTRGLIVAPGMHRIVVSRPGFAIESTQVDTTAGHSETVEITLERR